MFKRTLACVAGVVALACAGAAAGAPGPHTYYVAKTGKNSNPCTSTKPCATIGHAVGKAHKGDTVIVEAGTYNEDVRITKDIRVIGVGQPTVELGGTLGNGFVILGSPSAGATVSGFVVQDAVFEGILAENTSSITISNNVVRFNDRGTSASVPTGECAAHGQIPGDCGEGIHLMGVTSSKITGNRVFRNAGGILLTDETGPTAFNVIANNRVNRNALDCGITLAGHNGNAVSSSGKSGGVYGNTIMNNTVNRNGRLGQGGGILMATGAPGGGVWNNLVEGNTAAGNGLAGVVIHSHAPGEDLNGNRIKHNVLSHNGVNDASEAEFGLTDGTHSVTVDILVGSGFTKLTGIVIRGNLLENAHYGVFTKNDAKKVRKRRNAFVHVVVKVKQT